MPPTREGMRAPPTAPRAVQFKEAHLQQQLDLVTREKEWLAKELQSQSTEFAEYRREKVAVRPAPDPAARRVGPRAESLTGVGSPLVDAKATTGRPRLPRCNVCKPTWTASPMQRTPRPLRASASTSSCKQRAASTTSMPPPAAPCAKSSA